LQADELGCAPWELLDDPFLHLHPFIADRQAARGKRGPERFPLQAALDGGASRLWASDATLDWLIGERRISEEVIAKAELCLLDRHGRPHLTFPIGRKGQRRGLTFRALDGREPRYVNLRGWRATFYPRLPPSREVWLCAGMLDALVVLSHPIVVGKRLKGRRMVPKLWRPPICTTNVGAVLPNGLAPILAKRRVTVIYDAEEVELARKTRDKLRANGGEAQVVCLRKGDISDFYVRGGTTAQLREFIERKRR
jgi:hypothetical protein